MKSWFDDPILYRLARRWGLWLLCVAVAALFIAVGLTITGTTLAVAAFVAFPFVVRLGARDIAEQKRLAEEAHANAMGRLGDYLNRLKAENPKAYRKELIEAYTIAHGPDPKMAELLQFLETEHPLED